MKHYQEISCPHCGSLSLTKNGSCNKTDKQRYRCKSCLKSFLLEYSYKACEAGMKEKIEEQVLNGSGVRDTARILKISKNTVMAHLKKKP